jgi:hypothetical protein
MRMLCKEEDHTEKTDCASTSYTVDYYACFRGFIDQMTSLKRDLLQLQLENTRVGKDITSLQVTVVEMKNRCRRLKRKKRQRRATRELDKDFECPYHGCSH